MRPLDHLILYHQKALDDLQQKKKDADDFLWACRILVERHGLWDQVPVVVEEIRAAHRDADERWAAYVAAHPNWREETAELMRAAPSEEATDP